MARNWTCWRKGHDFQAIGGIWAWSIGTDGSSERVYGPVTMQCSRCGGWYSGNDDLFRLPLRYDAPHLDYRMGTRATVTFRPDGSADVTVSNDR
jgi:hypothetical protein